MKDWKVAVVSLAVFGLVSCEKARVPEQDVFARYGVDEVIKSDFLYRAGSGIRITDISGYVDADGIGTLEFCYDDERGRAHKTLYCNSIWQYDMEFIPMDALDSTLPLAVKKAFYGLDFEHEIGLYPDWGERFCLMTRRGIPEPYYEFCFHEILSERHVLSNFALISEGGEVLEDSHLGFNQSDWFYDFDDALGFISGRYPGSTVLAYANETGNGVFYLRHEGIRKKVYFRNNYKQYGVIEFAWRETVYPLPEGMTVPQSVLEKVGDLPYSEVIRYESALENGFGFKEGDTIVWVAEE